MPKICENALELIGNTPLVLLDRIHSGPGKIYGKLEAVNPGGSVKDRPALKIIQKAYEEKKLQHGQPVVEMTSGNMGAGLAIVCNVYQNPFIATMSTGNSPERAKMMRALGAEVVLVPQVDGELGKVTGKDLDAVKEKALEITKTRNAFFADQFNNLGSLLAHEEETGPEIWTALNTQIDAFVAIVGSGATFVGCSRFLKKKKASIFCAAVEPKGAEALKGLPITHTQHIIQGTGYASIPPLWDGSVADDYINISDEEAAQHRELLATREGLYVGFSSGANVCAAIKLLKSGKIKSDATVITILCDTGLKY